MAEILNFPGKPEKKRPRGERGFKYTCRNVGSPHDVKASFTGVTEEVEVTNGSKTVVGISVTCPEDGSVTYFGPDTSHLAAYNLAKDIIKERANNGHGGAVIALTELHASAVPDLKVVE